MARPLAVVVAKDTGEPGIAQPHRIALAVPGGIDDPLGNHLVNDGRLAPVVKRLAGVIERLAQDFGHSIVKDTSGLPDKRQNRAQTKFLSRQDVRNIAHLIYSRSISFCGSNDRTRRNPARVSPGFSRPSIGARLDIRRVRAPVGPLCFVHLGFEIGGLLEEASRNIWILGCFGELQKRRRLAREILPASHTFSPHRLTSPVSIKQEPPFRSAEMSKIEQTGNTGNCSRERDKNRHDDQGVDAGNGDAQAEIGHQAVRFEFCSFAAHLRFSSFEENTQQLGNRSATID
jgi:hypothetical protein